MRIIAANPSSIDDSSFCSSAYLPSFLTPGPRFWIRQMKMIRLTRGLFCCWLQFQKVDSHHVTWQRIGMLADDFYLEDMLALL